MAKRKERKGKLESRIRGLPKINAKECLSPVGRVAKTVRDRPKKQPGKSILFTLAGEVARSKGSGIDGRATM